MEETSVHKEAFFCPLPWNHLSSHANGDMRICCDMPGRAGTLYRDGEKALNFRVDSQTGLQNHPRLMGIRKKMIAGERPEECRSCWGREDLGLESRRQQLLKSFGDLQKTAFERTSELGEISRQDFPLEYLDLRLGNQCNLMCRTCGPDDSSQWRRYQLSGVSREFPSEWSGSSRLHESFFRGDLNQVRQFYFTGGEPLINRHHWGILKHLVQQGLAPKIGFNTTPISQSFPRRRSSCGHILRRFMSRVRWMELESTQIISVLQATGVGSKKIFRS